MKKYACLTFVSAFIVLIAGCGGGGGSNPGSGTGTGLGAYHSIQVTGYTALRQMLNTKNLIVGDTIQLDLTGRDKNNNLVVIKESGWTTDAPSGVATLTSDGVLTIVGASSSTYTISLVVNGVSFSSTLFASTAQDLVTGVVKNSVNPIEDVIVDFFDSTGSQVGQAYTARDGSFRASVPATAVTFTIDMSIADPGAVYYYPQYGYGADQYLSGKSCLAKLPGALSSTKVTTLPSNIVVDVRSGVPPPPPTGCLG